MPSFIRLDRRTIRHVLIFTAIFFFSAHLYRFTGTNFSHDSTIIFQRMDANAQFALGRFMQPIYWQLRGQVVVPFLIGLLSFVLLSAALCLVFDLLRIVSPLSIALCCMALSANGPLALANSTFVYSLDVHMLALLLSVAGVFLCVRLRFGFLLAPIALCMAIGLYQSYLQTAILLFLMCFVHDALDGVSAKAFLLRGLKAVCALLGGLLLYAAATRFVIAYKGLTLSTGYNGIDSVGQYAGFSIPALLLETFLYPFSYLFHQETIFPRLVSALYILVFAIGLFSLVRLMRLHGTHRAAKLRIALLVLLMPLGSNAVYFISKGMVHTLMLYAFYLALVLPVSLFERAVREKALPARSGALCTRLAVCAFSFAFLSNVIFCNQNYLKRDLEYQSTLSLMTRVIDRAEQVDGYQPGITPVAFVGTLEGSPLVTERNGFRHLPAMLGSGNVYATTGEYSLHAYIWQILGYPFNLVGGAGFEKREDVLAIPAFPAKGCCRMIDGTLVIRLSEPHVPAK